MCQFRIFVADTVTSELDQVVATRKADVETVEASSPIVLDDINGDGHLDLVQVIWMQERVLVFASIDRHGSTTVSGGIGRWLLPSFIFRLKMSIRNCW